MGKHHAQCGSLALLCVTLGEKGAYCFTRKERGYAPAYDLPSVDTTGAGDAFVGAVLYWLLNHTGGEIASLSREALLELVSFGNAAGSLATTKLGAIPAMPAMSEILECLHSSPKLKNCERKF